MDIAVVIEPDGTVKFLHDDALAPLYQEGTPHLFRASNVEPTSDGEWLADMSPIDGETMLGPFPLRNDALAAERAWLNQRLHTL